MITINEAIALANVVIALSLIAIGSAMLSRAWRRLCQWPVSGYLEMAAGYIIGGIVIGQLTVFRIAGIDRELGIWGTDGEGTLAVRLACAAIMTSIARRALSSGGIMTAKDREDRDNGSN